MKFKEVQSALELLTDSAESVFGRQNKRLFAWQSHQGFE